MKSPRTILALLVLSGTLSSLRTAWGQQDNHFGTSTALTLSQPKKVKAYPTGGLGTKMDSVDFTKTFSLLSTILDQQNERFGGSTNVALISSPKKVTAFLTRGLVSKKDSADPLDYWKKSDKSAVLSTNLITKVGQLLLDERTYLPLHQFSKNCIYLPGFVLTFSDGRRDVDVFFCLECDALIVRPDPNKNGPSESFHSDIDPSHKEFLQLMKQIFPDTPEIQSLKENE